MAAPEYVPVKPIDDVRAYESPPRRPDSWLARRPGDLPDGQPEGDLTGWPGPDQGYALVLARRFFDRLHLTTGEHRDDAVEGALGIALKRASLFGRAPIIHDLAVAFTLWGFLDPEPADDLVELRRSVFNELSLPLHYAGQRRLVAAVPEDVLRRPLAVIEAGYDREWRSQIDAAAFGLPA